MRIAPAAALLILASCARPAAQSGPLAPAGEPRRAEPAPAAAVAPASNPAVGGVVLPTNATVAADLAATPAFASLARALAAAGMAGTLAAAGPFTVFAPTEEAFARLQPGTVEALMKPENRAALIRLLGLHLVPERLGGLGLMRRIAAGGGRATLTTVAGEPLTVTLTNGIIHAVNGVLVPKLN